MPILLSSHIGQLQPWSTWTSSALRKFCPMIFLALRDLQLKDISCLEIFFFKRNAWQQHLKMICFSLQNLICFQIIIQYNHIEQFILIYKPFFLQESKDMERKTNKADRGHLECLFFPWLRSSRVREYIYLNTQDLTW